MSETYSLAALGQLGRGERAVRLPSTVCHFGSIDGGVVAWHVALVRLLCPLTGALGLDFRSTNSDRGQAARVRESRDSTGLGRGRQTR